MSKIAIVIARWAGWREVLRQWPWIDYVLGFVMAAWGACALLDWRAVVTESKFFALWYLVWWVGGLSLVVGSVRIATSAARRELGRQVASALGMFVLFSLAWNVETVTGHIAWGALAFLEVLVCFSLVVP